MQLGIFCSLPMKIMERGGKSVLGGLVAELMSSACLQVPKECIHSLIHKFDISNDY